MRNGHNDVMEAALQHGLIVRQKSPLNLEFPFASLRDWIVPTDQFFVRNHFPEPSIDPGAWRLRVTGAVETPLELDVDALMAMQRTELVATVECAGNGRVYYEPAREGLQWQNGAVGNARWKGAALGTLLAQAGALSSAVEVVLVGADRGHVDAGKKTASPGAIAFARSLPVATALSPGTVLAYEMNGAPLEPEHGFPLRAVVGGWFGMAWVKWLTEVRVVEQPFLGYWQSRDYFRWDRGFGEPTLVPLGAMEVKSIIARPVNAAVVPLGQPCRIFGAAWSGEAPVCQVDLLTSDTGEWSPARLQPSEHGYAWRLWSYDWTPSSAGPHMLRCRATDGAGNVQPDAQQPDRESYVANWSVPVQVKVVAGAAPDEAAFAI